MKSEHEPRKFSTSETSFPMKLDGNLVVKCCWRCSHFGSQTLCKTTGEIISYPVSGPVGSLCQLPDYHYPEQEGAANA